VHVFPTKKKGECGFKREKKTWEKFPRKREKTRTLRKGHEKQKKKVQIIDNVPAFSENNNYQNEKKILGLCGGFWGFLGGLGGGHGGARGKKNLVPLSKTKAKKNFRS